MTRTENGTTTTLPLQTKGQVSAVTAMEQSRVFMGADTLRMTVTSATPITFKIGDTIYVHGDPYTLNRLPTAKKEGERKYTYTLELEGGQYGLITSQFLLWDNITDAMVAAPSQSTLTELMLNSLTGNATDVLKMIVLNANRVNGDGAWVVGTTPANTDTLLFTLESATCLEALQKMCEQWELEFTIETNATTGVRTINLAAIPSTIPTAIYAFEYGRTGGLYTIERSSKGDDVITRLYAFGGTQNVPSSYLTESNTNRLCIRQAGGTRKRHLSYVENSSFKTLYGIRERVEVFEDIYPQRTGSVTLIYTTGDSPELRFRDSSMFDLNARNQETGETLYLIPGATAKITFQTGQLAGYTFEITEFNSTYKRFYIKPIHEEGDLVLPSPDIAQFRVAVGDTYILTDINLPDSYITAAEDKLKTEATKKLAEINDDMFQYTIEVDSRFIEKHAAAWGRTADHPFIAGDAIGIIDTALGINVVLRLTAYTHDLINKKYTLTVERYRVKQKTTQTRRRRRFIDMERYRMERIVSTNIQNELYEAATEIIEGRGTYPSLNGRYSAVEQTASNANTTAGNAMTEITNARGGQTSLALRLADFLLQTTFDTFKGSSGDFGLLKTEVQNARGSGHNTLADRFADYLLETTFNTFKGSSGEFGLIKAEIEAARGNGTLSSKFAEYLTTSVFNTFKGATGDFGRLLAEVTAARGSRTSLSHRISDVASTAGTADSNATAAKNAVDAAKGNYNTLDARMTAVAEEAAKATEAQEEIDDAKGTEDTLADKISSIATQSSNNNTELYNARNGAASLAARLQAQDTTIGNKANSADVYTKSQVYTKSETYTKSEVNTSLQEKAAASLFAGVSFTLDKETVDGKDYTIAKEVAEQAGNYPRIVMLDSEGLEVQPLSVARAGAIDAITIELTQQQLDDIESDKSYTLVLIQ